jgi:SPP1 family predicted phage head-tail adaptor
MTTRIGDRRVRLPLTTGELKHRCTFRIPVHTKGSDGKETTTYVSPPTPIVWCAIEPQSGRPEFVQAQQINARAEILVRIRYRRDIKPSWQVVIDGNTYEIVAPPKDPDYAHRELWLVCARVVR